MLQTLKLVFAGVLWAPVLGIFIGVISAIKHGKDAGPRQHADCVTGLSAPGFWLGVMGIQIFSVQLGWLPSGGLDSWKGFIPSLVYHGMWYHGSTCKIFPFLHAGNSA